MSDADRWFDNWSEACKKAEEYYRQHEKFVNKIHLCACRGNYEKLIELIRIEKKRLRESEK